MDVLSSLTFVLSWKLSCKITGFSLCQEIKEKLNQLKEATLKKKAEAGTLGNGVGPLHSDRKRLSSSSKS